MSEMVVNSLRYEGNMDENLVIYCWIIIKKAEY